MLVISFRQINHHILISSLLTYLLSQHKHIVQHIYIRYIFAFVFTREFQFHTIFAIWNSLQKCHSYNAYLYILGMFVYCTYIHVGSIFPYLQNDLLSTKLFLEKKTMAELSNFYMYVYAFSMGTYINNLEKVLRVCLCFCYNFKKLSCTILYISK